MKQCGSSGGGGVARDVEPERCRLDGTVFLGAIVVTDGSKSEKKKCTQEETRDKGAQQKKGGGKKSGHRGYLKRPGTRVASPRRRHAM